MHVRGHRGTVSFVEWLSHDRLLTVGADRRLLVWRIPQSTIEADVRAGDRPICGCTVSPDRTRICVADLDGIVRLYDTDGLTLGPTWKASLLGVSGLRFSPDGRYVASAGGGGDPVIWDIATRTAVADLRETVRFTTFVAWCPTGTRVVFGYSTKEHLISVSTADWRVEWKRRPLVRLMESPSTRRGRSSSPGRTRVVHVLDPATGRTPRTARVPHRTVERHRAPSFMGADASAQVREGPVAWADDEFRMHISDAARSQERSTILFFLMSRAVLRAGGRSRRGKTCHRRHARTGIGVWTIGRGEVDRRRCKAWLSILRCVAGLR